MNYCEIYNIQRYTRYSKEISLPEALCGKTWRTIGDTGEDGEVGEDVKKEQYTFGKDGQVEAQIDGVHKHYTWAYFEKSDSMLINMSEEQGLFLKPMYVSDDLVVCCLDQMTDCVCMVDTASDEMAYIRTGDDMRRWLVTIDTAEKEDVAYARAMMRYEQSEGYERCYRLVRMIHWANVLFALWMVLLTIVTLLLLAAVMDAMIMDKTELKILAIVAVVVVYMPLLVWLLYARKKCYQNATKKIKRWTDKQYPGTQGENGTLIDPMVIYRMMLKKPLLRRRD